MPVDRNSHSGVCTVTAGSSTTARGMIRGWRISSFTPAALVGDAGDRAELAARQRRRHGDLRDRGRSRQGGGPRAPSGPATGRSASSASAVRMSLARQSCTALAPSVIEPPPTVTIRSASASRAIAAASMTARRGVCGGIRSNSPAKRLPSARRTLAISSVVRLSVPLTIRNTRSASRRRASSATASAAGRPNVFYCAKDEMGPKWARPVRRLGGWHLSIKQA